MKKIFTGILIAMSLLSFSQKTGDAILDQAKQIQQDDGVVVRLKNKQLTRIYPLSGSNFSSADIKPLNVPIIIRPGSDVRVVAISSGTGTQVKALISGHLAIIIN